MAIENNENWRSFIEKYENFEELWNVRSEKYKNKFLRAKAYEALLQEYKRIDEKAYLATLKRRLNNMRTAYRRELKKKMKSEEKSGAGADEVYEPSLWYFYLLGFLNDVETPAIGISSISSSEENIDTINVTAAEKRKKPSQSALERNDFLRKATAHLEGLGNKAGRDESVIYAEAWACSYRKLSAEQKLYAKKAVDEIFVMAELNKLTLNTISQGVSWSSTPFAYTRPQSRQNSFEYVALPEGSPLVYGTIPQSDVVNNEETFHYTSINDLLSSQEYH